MTSVDVPQEQWFAYVHYAPPYQGQKEYLPVREIVECVGPLHQKFEERTPTPWRPNSLDDFKPDYVYNARTLKGTNDGLVHNYWLLIGAIASELVQTSNKLY